MNCFYLLPKRSFQLFLISIVAIFHFSCERTPIEPKINTFTNGVFVLNEGLFHQNNATLTFYDFNTKKVYNDIFTDVNHRGLGDIGNDLRKYGSKLYCVVNNSNIVEVIDAATIKSLKTISLPGKQPRNVVFLNNKAYISCFDGDVVKIDTSSLNIEGMIYSGKNPDGICVCNNKIYVANSGGLDYPNYGKTVTVIDPVSFTVMKEITVEINPTRIKKFGNNYIYVVSNGNYGSIPYKLQKIDCNTDELIKTYDLEVLNLTIHNNRAYIYSYNYSSQESWIKVLNLDNDEIESEQFITDGTKIITPYCIDVDQRSGDVWITDAGNFTANGDVYCFDKSGKKKFSFEAGLCPQAVVINK